MKERLNRQARNEALMRTVNDEIAAIDERATGWAESGQQFEFQCECGKGDGCESRLLMTLEEYEHVRGQRDRFAVVPGHENGEIEHVVVRSDRYLVVDKRDAFEHLVE
ncbi:MAG TPA: hypothetical protein VGW30_00250 [Gaiellaceae bacterium]|nr:hypothetical protein [Gaiellaceae bacterium]